MTKKDHLIELISNDEFIKRYKRLETIINDDPEIKGKLDQLKLLQKQMINLKKVSKNQAYQAKEKIYNELLIEIENLPLLNDYLAMQSDINQFLQQFFSIIEEGINKDFDG